MAKAQAAYYVAEARSSGELMLEVDRLSAEGWTPQGGVTVALFLVVGGRHELWAQAMVNREKNDDR